MNSSLLMSFLILIVIILISGGILYFTSIKNKFEIKNNPAVNELKKSIGLSIEDGRGIHISIGKSDIQNIHGAASLVGLETLNQILDQSVLSDNPPITTAGSGDIALLAQSKLQKIESENANVQQETGSSAYLAGATNYGYIAGVIPHTVDPNLSSQVFVGNIGPEIGLLLDTNIKQNHFSLAATDNLEGQSVSYAFSNEALIGEEIFSVPAQLNPKNETKKISLILHDLLRWLVIGIILIAILLKLIGLL